MMSNRFKFGDKVRHISIDEELIVLSDEPKKNLRGGVLWLVYAEPFGAHWVGEYKLEPIPHPDTVRLDFLIKHGAYIEPPNSIHDFHISQRYDCYGKPDRMREALDMVINKKTKGKK